MIELDAVYRNNDGDGGRVSVTPCTIIGFYRAKDAQGRDVLHAVAIPMKSGVPFDAPAWMFEVKDLTYRRP